MRPKHTFLVVTSLLIMLLSSCEKCMECSYKTLEGKEIFEEKCGNSDEILDFETRIRLESNEHRDPANCRHSR